MKNYVDFGALSRVLPDPMGWTLALTIGGVIVAPLVGFVAWRFTSVARGARTRDEALLQRLDPLAKRIEEGARISPDEIEALANYPELRPMLHALLQHYDLADLFPARHLSEEAQAESALVYWMLHPNELQAAASAIEVEEKVIREISGRQGVFYVFRFQMPEGHWAGLEWQLGLAGPFFAEARKPYEEMAGAFSRGGDFSGKTLPSEIVDWYIDMLRSKGAA